MKVTVILQRNETSGLPVALTIFPGENAPMFPAKIQSEKFSADTTGLSKETTYWEKHSFIRSETNPYRHPLDRESTYGITQSEYEDALIDLARYQREPDRYRRTVVGELYPDAMQTFDAAEQISRQLSEARTTLQQFNPERRRAELNDSYRANGMLDLDSEASLISNNQNPILSPSYPPILESSSDSKNLTIFCKHPS